MYWPLWSVGTQGCHTSVHHTHTHTSFAVPTSSLKHCVFLTQETVQSSLPEEGRTHALHLVKLATCVPLLLFLLLDRCGTASWRGENITSGHKVGFLQTPVLLTSLGLELRGSLNGGAGAQVPGGSLVLCLPLCSNAGSNHSTPHPRRQAQSCRSIRARQGYVCMWGGGAGGKACQVSF